MTEKKLIPVVIIVAFCLCVMLSLGIVYRSRLETAARAKDIAVLRDALDRNTAKSSELVAKREFEQATATLRELEPKITTMSDVNLEEQLRRTMWDVAEADREYRTKLNEGYSVFEGEFISEDEKKHVLAERKLKREEEEGREEEARRIAKVERDRRILKEEQRIRDEAVAREIEREETRGSARQETEKRRLEEQAKAKLQLERKQFIQDLINKGYWLKTELTGSLPRLWVTQQFLLTDEISQNKLLSVVYAYWADELEDFGGNGFYWKALVLKVETGTQLGRRVGTYDPVKGIRFE